MESLFKILKTFKCRSNCSLGKEILNDDIKEGKICFNSLDLKQKDIKLLNKIINKRPSTHNYKYKYITEL
tara:strand:- start:804 stop:1013 length:210 start_codon:yes stop_codon:yes gene_type:complete